jgi:hypothetical protein
MVRWIPFFAVGLCLMANAHAGKKNKKNKAASEPQVVEIEQGTAELTENTDGTGDLIRLPCDWAEGAVFTYDYRSEKHSPDSETPVVMTYGLALTVKKSGDPQTIRYLGGEPEVSGPEELIAPLKAAVEGLPPMPLDVVLFGGAVTGLGNFEELAPSLEIMTQRMFGDDGSPASVHAQAMFANAETASPLLLVEPQSFFTGHCVNMREGQRVVADVNMPSPLGGVVKGTSTVWLEALDTEAGTVTYRSDDVTDPESTAALVRQMISQVVPEGAEQAAIEQALAMLPPIDNRINMTMVMSLTDGFPISMRIEQTVGMEGHAGHRTEIKSWTRVAK